MAQRRQSVAERVYRARRIGVTFGRVYLGIKAQQFIARRLAPSDMPARWSRFHRVSAAAIYDAAIELRGLILKGCQFIGSRADVLPPEYVELLSKLQDQVPAKAFPVVRRTVERELGCKLDDLFASFSEQPIASASLAQVHEARLQSGERVAVKVQYPEIERLVRSDLSNLRVLFRAVGVIERDFDLMPLVNELGKHVPLELNFVHEAHNAEKVARYFDDRDDIHVPRIHWEYTTRRVLVMEFVEGIKISDAAALRAAGCDPEAVMRTLIEAYCEQILTRGFFHADPHPGNLIVQPTPTGPRLVFVDFGLAKELPGRFRRGILELAGALVEGSVDTMAQALHDLGFETRSGGIEPLTEIARAVLDIAVQLRHQAYLDPQATREAGNELPRLIRENPIVSVPSHVVLLARVIALLSGLGRTLDAHVNMLQTILPYVLKPARSGTHPPGEPVPARPAPPA